MDESTRNRILLDLGWALLTLIAYILIQHLLGNTVALTSKIAIFIVLSALLLLNDFKWKKNDLNKKKNKEPEKNIKRHRIKRKIKSRKRISRDIFEGLSKSRALRDSAQIRIPYFISVTDHNPSEYSKGTGTYGKTADLP